MPDSHKPSCWKMSLHLCSTMSTPSTSPSWIPIPEPKRPARLHGMSSMLCFAFACTKLTYFPRSSSSPAPSDVIFCSDTSFNFQLNPFIDTNNFTLYVSHSTDSLYGFTYLYGSAPWEPSSGPLDCVVPEPGESVCQATSVSVPIF